MQEPDIAFNITHDDILEAYRDNMTASSFVEAIRRSRLRNIGTVAVWGALGFVFSFGGIRLWRDMINGTLPSYTPIIAGVVMIITVASMIPYWSVSRNRQRALATWLGSIDRPPGFGSTGAVSVAVTDEGLAYCDDFSRSVFSWRVIESIERVERYLVIVTLNQRMIAVPHAAFATQDDAEAFEHQVRERVDGVPPSETAIARVLYAKPMVCPDCSYELDGVRGAICPECGHEVTPAELAAPYKLLAKRPDGKPPPKSFHFSRR